MTDLSSPDVAVVFVPLRVFVLAGTALSVAAAMAQRNRRRVPGGFS